MLSPFPVSPLHPLSHLLLPCSYVSPALDSLIICLEEQWSEKPLLSVNSQLGKPLLPIVDTGRKPYMASAVCGVDEMSTQDIFSYFKEYPPAHIEWLDDTSCKYTYIFGVVCFRL